MPVGKRPGRRAKLGAKQETKDVRTFIYKRTGWPRPGKQPDHGTQRQDKMQRGVDSGPVAKGNIQVHSHTCMHMCAVTHMHSQCTHAHTCPHTYLHTGAFVHMARTYVHIHTCLHAHTLILTHRHVLISGSWLPFWRFKPPRATSLHEALLRTPIQPSRAQVMCPTSTSTWPAKLDTSERVQDDLQALGGGQGCQGSRRGQEGADHSLLPRPGVSGGRITDGQRPCGGIRKHTHWETALGRGTPRKGVLVAVGFGVKYHAGWEFSI